jgi:ABC-type dipeptide/oligopeptide/nickel transport system permease subunit
VLIPLGQVDGFLCLEQHGLLNNRLTLANGIWILLGISLWALILLGLASGYFPEQTDSFLSSLIETVS